MVGRALIWDFGMLAVVLQRAVKWVFWVDQRGEPSRKIEGDFPSAVDGVGFWGPKRGGEAGC